MELDFRPAEIPRVDTPTDCLGRSRAAPAKTGIDTVP